jgi:death-on-curing protein
VIDEPVFLTLDQVLRIHSHMVELFGGADGIRDLPLLESALAQPAATFGGEYLLKDIALMAAAYLFGITKNHPFIDGNKRTGAAAATVFLELNGYELQTTHDEELAEITERIAASQATREELDQFFRERAIEL